MGCKHCEDTGLVSWEAGGKQTVEPCGCILEKGINVSLRGGGVSIKFVEGGGIVLQAADNGGCDGSPPDRITFAVDRDDLKKVIKALKKARDIAEFMGGKRV